MTHTPTAALADLTLTESRRAVLDALTTPPAGSPLTPEQAQLLLTTYSAALLHAEPHRSELTAWAAALTDDGLVPESTTPTAWADDEAQLRVHLAFSPHVPQHDREQVTDAIAAFTRHALH